VDDFEAASARPLLRNVRLEDVTAIIKTQPL
jgi:hypothetical protein